MTSLTGRRLLFVTGKGGTGKSTVAAAIALRASQEGRRTLLVEMDAKGTSSVTLGATSVSYRPVHAGPNLSVMAMDTEESLREYLRVHLKLPLVAKIGPLASMFDFVADAAPGVREILAVGKVCWEVKEDHFDLVVVDAEASGHVVAQIASPRTIKSLVPRGPLSDQTAWMLRILDDPAQCGVVVVTTPEEMPVTEATALIGRVRAETRTDVAAVVVNNCEPAVSDIAAALADDPWFAGRAPRHAAAVAMSRARRAGQSAIIESLSAETGDVPRIELPASPLAGARLAGHLAGFFAAESTPDGGTAPEGPTP